MPEPEKIPLLSHPLEEKTAFRPEDLVSAVSRDRGRQRAAAPAICVLDFDGDLTDWLAETGRSERSPDWSCFHTEMEMVRLESVDAGVVGRTIGGPYAVLVAEQMLVQGAEVIVGLTSAGRVSPELPVPSLVVPTSALRDEGASYHYLPPAATVDAPAGIAQALADEAAGFLPLAMGRVWTTDAPYRETASQLRDHAAAGVLAVEMQAASLFALAAVRERPIGILAHVTNGGERHEPSFDTGGVETSFELLRLIVRAAQRVIAAKG